MRKPYFTHILLWFPFDSWNDSHVCTWVYEVQILRYNLQVRFVSSSHYKSNTKYLSVPNVYSLRFNNHAFLLKILLAFASFVADAIVWNKRIVLMIFLSFDHFHFASILTIVIPSSLKTKVLEVRCVLFVITRLLSSMVATHWKLELQSWNVT